MALSLSESPVFRTRTFASRSSEDSLPSLAFSSPSSSDKVRKAVLDAYGDLTAPPPTPDLPTADVFSGFEGCFVAESDSDSTDDESHYETAESSHEDEGSLIFSSSLENVHTASDSLITSSAPDKEVTSAPFLVRSLRDADKSRMAEMLQHAQACSRESRSVRGREEIAGMLSFQSSVCSSSDTSLNGSGLPASTPLDPTSISVSEYRRSSEIAEMLAFSASVGLPEPKPCISSRRQAQMDDMLAFSKSFKVPTFFSVPRIHRPAQPEPAIEAQAQPSKAEQGTQLPISEWYNFVKARYCGKTIWDGPRPRTPHYHKATPAQSYVRSIKVKKCRHFRNYDRNLRVAYASRHTAYEGDDEDDEEPAVQRKKIHRDSMTCGKGKLRDREDEMDMDYGEGAVRLMDKWDSGTIVDTWAIISEEKTEEWQKQATPLDRLKAFARTGKSWTTR